MRVNRLYIQLSGNEVKINHENTKMFNTNGKERTDSFSTSRVKLCRSLQDCHIKMNELMDTGLVGL